MATFDFTPMFRSTIGFDRLPELLADALERVDPGYPPYNIEKLGEDRYRIVMAVAGFGQDDIELVQKSNRLTVRGRAQDVEERAYLHRGIAGRSFVREFDLADHVDVIEAHLDQGLLSITLQREVPEAFKPRAIKINAGPSLSIADRTGTARAA
jgi:molecular chaperone IbpA